MPSKVSVNNRTVVHATSNGVAPSFPDVCKTPSPGGPIPIPYPNIAQSSDTAQGSQSVKVEGNPIMLQGSNFAMSTGDEAGSAGGVVSGQIKAKAEFVNYSFDVKIDGKSVPRLGDPMVHNKGGAPNTGPFPEVQPPCPAVLLPTKDDKREPNELLKLEIQNRPASSKPASSPSSKPLSLKLADQKGAALAGTFFRATAPDGTVITGQLDDKGTADIAGIEGEAHITFPGLEPDED